MDRDQLEFVIYQHIGRVARTTLALGEQSTSICNAAVDAILAAAEDYATSHGGITADRRAVLAASWRNGNQYGRDGRAS